MASISAGASRQFTANIDRAEEGTAEEHVEIGHAVAVEQRDPVVGTDSVTNGGLRDPTGHGELFGPGPAHLA